MIDDTGFTDKASKNPDERALYEAGHDYQTAYGLHTDLRVRRDGHSLAIGGMWEEHGPLQLEFLQKQGLKEDSYLLDLGCGTGRLARHAVPFLEAGHYTGLDLSDEALKFADNLSVEEGWSDKEPVFRKGDGGLEAVKDRPADIIWAHSVFTHLPDYLIRQVMKDVSERDFDVFLFTFKRHTEPRRSGLKQFQYPPQFFMEVAEEVGLVAEEVGYKFPHTQPTMRAYRP